jgi:hypothetical protein
VVQGCDKVNTTRRWAWKQPSLKEIVIDHWSRISYSSFIAPKM